MPSVREKIAEYIYTQEMDSRYQNFFSWEQAKSEASLKGVVNDYLKQADYILSLIKAELLERTIGMPYHEVGNTNVTKLIEFSTIIQIIENLDKEVK